MPIFFRLKTQLIVFGLLLMMAIILSHLGGIDRDISRYFYDITNHWWLGNQIYFFKFSYQYLTAPAYFVWLYVSTEFFYRKFIIGESINANYKQLARLKLILSLLGALLAVELIKHFIDRARPYMLTEFGGSFDYQAIGFLVSDGASNGNSFPSGHAVAGFCLTSLFYYFYKANLKKAYFWYGGGMLLGTILAITRLTQGGHYLSDILSSLAISQMVVTTVSRLKLPIGKYNKNLVVLNPQSISYRLKKYGIIIIFSISWGIWIFGVFFNQLSLLNTKESFVFTPSAKPILIKTDVAGVKVRVIENQSQENMIKIRFDVDARGTTFFSLTPQVILKQENDHPILYVTINKSIFIRRLGGDIDIYLPGTQPYRLLKIIDDK